MSDRSNFWDFVTKSFADAESLTKPLPQAWHAEADRPPPHTPIAVTLR
jgi:hypothetical protein